MPSKRLDIVAGFVSLPHENSDLQVKTRVYASGLLCEAAWLRPTFGREADAPSASLYYERLGTLEGARAES